MSGRRLPVPILLLCGMIATAPLPCLAAGNPNPYRPTVALTDNADEPNDKGWCMDIVGPMSPINCSAPLHLHSCKPDPQQSLDMMFEYIADEQLIRSAHYTGDCRLVNSSDDLSGGCATIVGDAIVEGVEIEIADCANEASPGQGFFYNVTTELVHAVANDSLCLVGGAEILDAGPWKRRTMFLQSCGTVSDSVLEMWTMQSSSGQEENNATRPVEDAPPPGEEQNNDATQPTEAPDQSTSSSWTAALGHFSSKLSLLSALLLLFF